MTGLAGGAASGGTASLKRTDIGGQTPVDVQIPGSGSVTTSLFLGTYGVVYTAPDGYQLTPGSPSSETAEIESGQTASVTFAVQTSEGFAPPDLLNNASFENGWENFHGRFGTSEAPSVSGGSLGFVTITRSQDQAVAGSWSAKSTFSPNPSNDAAINMMYDFGGRGHVFVRIYFYATGVPTNQHKWIRFYDVGGGNAMGVQHERSRSGAITWVFNNSTGCVNCGNRIGAGVATLNAWHSLEIDYDAANGRVRFYYDGRLTVPIVDNLGITIDALNGWIRSAGGATPNPRYLVFDDTYNAGNSASGAFYYDKIAISTQRIGP